MAATIRVYNHTAARFRSGANAVGDTYRVNLYTVLPANLTATTKAGAESGATQLATANGYTQNSKILTGLTSTIINTNGSKWDADDVEWIATGGSIAADFALVYNDTDADDPPVFSIDFGETKTALDTIPFVIAWNPSGIFTDGYV